jgi:hypothetical protein
MDGKAEKIYREKFNSLGFLLRNIFTIFEFLDIEEENVKLLIYIELIDVFCFLV